MNRKLSIYDPPSFANEEATREWVLRILQFADMLSDITDNAIDDQIIAWVTALVENDEAWEIIYNLISSLIGRQGAVLFESEEVDLRKCLGDDSAFDPSILIFLIQIGMQIYNWWKSR